MDPILEKINANEQYSFLVNQVRLNYFQSPWHYHPEVEIMLITEGYGTRLIGDNIGRFDKGEIAIIGSNLPHVWLNDQSFYEKNSRLKAGAIFIQFREDFWGNHFYDLPEMKSISSLLKKAQRGLQVTGTSKDQIRELIENIYLSEGFDRLIILFRILKSMAESVKDYVELSSVGFIRSYHHEDSHRINKIYEYLVGNYTKVISLEEVAQLVNMSPTSFCRYFKSKTNKTLFRFINEIRVGHACKLLIENSQSITEICYACGFNHFSNFHKQFISVVGLSPMKYRQKFLKKSYKQ